MLQSPDSQVQQCTFSVFLAVAERINFNTLTTFCSQYFATFSRQSTPRENVYLSFLYLLSRDVLLASRCSYCSAKSWTLTLLCWCCCLFQNKKWSSHLLDNVSNCFICAGEFNGIRTHDLCDTSASLRIPLNSPEFVTWDNCLNCPTSARIISSIHV